MTVESGSFISLWLWSVVWHCTAVSSLWDSWQFCPFTEQSSMSQNDMLEIASHYLEINFQGIYINLWSWQLLVWSTSSCPGLCTQAGKPPLWRACSRYESPKSLLCTSLRALKKHSKCVSPSWITEALLFVRHTQHAVHLHLSDWIISILSKTTCFLRAELTLTFFPTEPLVIGTMTQNSLVFWPELSELGNKVRRRLDEDGEVAREFIGSIRDVNCLHLHYISEVSLE